MDKDPKGETFLYCHGNSVIIRNLASPQMSDIYTQHSTQVNVAKYSPSGFYIASADKSGKVDFRETVGFVSKHGGAVLSDEELKSIFKDFDESLDNEIDQGEFVKFFSRTAGPMSNAQFEEMVR